jgi:hypothetical protein
MNSPVRSREPIGSHRHPANARNLPRIRCLFAGVIKVGACSIWPGWESSNYIDHVASGRLLRARRLTNQFELCYLLRGQICSATRVSQQAEGVGPPTPPTTNRRRAAIREVKNHWTSSGARPGNLE